MPAAPEDPLGALERELIAAARRRFQIAPRNRPHGPSWAVAVACVAFGAFLVLAAVLFVALR